MPPLILEYLLSLISIYLVIALTAAFHVLLYKRDSRSALAWVGLVLLFPIAGAILYVLFGINRVRRKARRLSLRVSPEGGSRRLALLPGGGASLRNPGYSVTGTGTIPGNRTTAYYNGEQAFPAMLDAIDRARHEIELSTYIFDNDATGRDFVRRLAAARERGVHVRVLVDDAGIRYSFPTILRELKNQGLDHRRFMPLRLVPPSLSINLRTHRKLLVVDRAAAFAGGMNIGDRQLVEGLSRHRASDLHFRFEGPVVSSFITLFEDDWRYARGGEPLVRERPTMPVEQPAGRAQCRLVPDGPDETLDSLVLVICGTISCARKRIWIMTPYFLPDAKISGCLEAAAIAGVDVTVMIPQKNNWPVVQWALQHTMSHLLEAGVTILERSAPFAHSKCMIIDDDYLLVGSANMDPRSLRLNFELGIEVFDPDLNRELADHFTATSAECRPYTLERLRRRSVLTRLRDAAAAMFTPYL